MRLAFWKSTNEQLQNVKIYVNSIFDVTSDFFSAPNILDMFILGDSKRLTLPHIQHFLDSNTSDFMINLNYMTQEAFTKAFFNVKTFSTFSGSFASELFNSPLSSNYNLLVQDIADITSAKTNSFDMRAVFMEFNHEIGMFDVILSEVDADLHENLSTPDVKLYYPEPFIASPSFVHEDLWYIHILHYQHWL